MASASGELLTQWKLVKDRDGIQVYMKHRDESRLKTFRGVTVMHLEDPYAIVAIFNDYGAMPNWLHMISNLTEIRRDDYYNRFLEVKTRLPWPLQDRKAIIKAEVEQNPQTAAVIIRLLNRPNMLPDDGKYVVIPELYGRFYFELKGKNQVQVTYEVILDPGGYIPAWVANLILKDVPFFTLKKLSRFIKLPKYQNQPTDKLSFPEEMFGS